MFIRGYDDHLSVFKIWYNLYIALLYRYFVQVVRDPVAQTCSINGQFHRDSASVAGHPSCPLCSPVKKRIAHLVA